MADPIQTFLATDNGTTRLGKHNDNLQRRHWVDVVNATATTYTVTADNEWIDVDPTSNAVTLNLPAVADVDGMTLFVRAANVTNTITLDGSGAETINGAATKTIGTAGRVVLLRATSGGWAAVYMDLLP